MKEKLIKFANLLNLYQTLMNELDTKPGDDITVEKIIYVMFIYLIYWLTSIIRKIVILILFFIMIADSLSMETIKKQYHQQRKKRR